MYQMCIKCSIKLKFIFICKSSDEISEKLRYTHYYILTSDSTLLMSRA